MKKIIFFIMGAALPLSFLFSQQSTSKALSVGDTVDDLVFSHIINYNKSSAKISDFDGKLLILDFWATWCGPCIKGLPKFDSLQAKFGDRIQILPVSKEKSDIVSAFLKKKQLHLPSVVEDTLLKTYFPYRVIPHSVWIGKNRKVVAITSSDYISGESIAAVLEGRKAHLPLKEDIVNFDPEKPLFLKESDDSLILYRSVVTKNIRGIASQDAPIYRDSVNIGFHHFNSILPQLFLYALRKPESYWYSRVLFENVKDSTRYVRDYNGDGMYMQEWSRNNTYCYELIAPTLSFKERWRIMFDDLNRASKGLFGLTARMENRTVKCFVIKVKDAAEFGKIKTSGKPRPGRKFGIHSRQLSKSIYKEFSMDQFAHSLEAMCRLPVVDGTRYKGVINFEIDDAVSAAIRKARSATLLSELLQKYGLELREEPRKIEMLVLSES